MQTFEDTELNKIGIEVPAWIDPHITVGEIKAIIQGGCSSGTYMPAVIYHQALKTMDIHGDDVIQYIEDSLGELPAVPKNPSWPGIAVFCLSCAVELWASGLEAQLNDLESAALDG